MKKKTKPAQSSKIEVTFDHIVEKTKYQTKDFYGTVVLKDWMSDLNDRNVKRLTGFCTLVQDIEIAGFKTRGTEANWGMRVVGKQQQWTILGCQIRAVVAHGIDQITQASLDGALVLEQ
jgi:hypothetical protein